LLMALPPNLTVRASTPIDLGWHSLHFFNLYRFLLAGILLAVVDFFGTSFTFGSQYAKLFIFTSVAYLLFSAACAALISTRKPPFNAQLSLQVSADVVFIVLLMFASGGISSGLGLLLFVPLAGAGLISRGRLSMFHAALAAIAILLEQTYRVLALDGGVGRFVQAGMTSTGYFAAAWVAHALAKYTQASEQLAAQRGVDLANLARQTSS
jgi:two-component system sensor histidine kinase PilS (NtrC family)